MKYKPRKPQAADKAHPGSERNITVRTVQKDVPDVHALARALLRLSPAQMDAIHQEHDEPKDKV